MRNGNGSEPMVSESNEKEDSMIQWKPSQPDPSAVRLVIPSGDGFTDCRRNQWQWQYK